MKIQERYSAAINSKSLVSDPDTTWSDTDVLGAMGLASVSYPLATALVRQ